MKQYVHRIAWGGMAFLFALSLVVPFLPIGKTDAAVVQAPFTEEIIDPGEAPWGKQLADLDGDGLKDAIEAGPYSGMHWYRYPSWQKFQVSTDCNNADDLQVADINGDGALDLVTTNGVCWLENPRGTGGNVTGTWAHHPIDPGVNSHDVVAGDVNADGKTDVLARGTGETGPTYLYLQGATPTTWTKVSMPNALSGVGSALADIDQDNKVDIVGNGYWLKQPADPTNGSSWTRYSFVTWTPSSGVTVSDMNSDGRVDVLISPSEVFGGGQLSWFENPTNPAGGAWPRHDVAQTEDVHRFHVADVNKDGKKDIVFGEMHQSATHRVGVFYNEGDSLTWTLQTISTQGSHNIAVGDVENDGDVDILGANWDVSSSPDGAALKLWRNGLNPTVGLDNWTYIQADASRDSTYFGLTMTDATGDGYKDIASGKYFYRNPGGNMAGTWTRSELVPGTTVDALLSVNVDGDTMADIIAMDSSGNVRWLEAANAQATSWNSVTVGNLGGADHGISTQGYTSGQIVPGGREEIVLSFNGIRYFSIPANPGAGNWPVTSIGDGINEGVSLSDIDNDGDLDAVSGNNFSTPSVAWFENPGTGAGNWASHTIGNAPSNIVDRVEVADFNGDGRKDVAVAVANGSANGVYWFAAPADPEATNWTRSTVVAQDSTNSMDVADMDSDGDADIIAGEHMGPKQTAVWANNGAGAFTRHVVDNGRENHLGTQVTDLDGDTDLDIVGIAWDDFPLLHVWRNDNITVGDGVPPVISGVAAVPADVAATVTWTTNETATSQVEYGTTTAYGSTTPLDSNLVTAHSVSITGLTPQTTYHYRVLSRDGAGNLTTSGDFTFTTAEPDTTAPVISNVAANGVAATTATITWATNELADSQVEYGTTTSYGSTTPVDTDLITAHTVDLTGLTPQTTYHYRVKSKDAAGNLTTSGDFTFTTTQQVPIVHVQTSGVTNDDSSTTMTRAFTSANTAGNTIVAAASWAGSGALTCSDTQGNTYATATSHYDNLRDQSLGVCYAANIKAGANTVTANFSSSGSFRRLIIHEYSGLATASPVDVTAKNVSTGTTAANGITSTAATTTVDGALIFGATMDDDGTTSITAGTGFTQRNSVNNKDLVTQDRVQASAGSVASTMTFGTAHRYMAHMVAFKPGTPPAPDTTAPVISNVASSNIAATGATITWTTNEASDTQVEYGPTVAYGSTSPLNTALTTAHTVNLTGLTPETTYHYQVRSRDAAGNLATLGDFTFTTPPAPDTTAPTITNVVSSNVGTTEATITWDTNEAADTQVAYGTTTAYGSVSSLDPTLLTSHGATLTNLTPGVTYHYQVLSRDAAGNLAASTDFTFTTVSVPDTTAPVISSVASSGVTTNSATITWATDELSDTQVEYGTSESYGSTTPLNSALVTSHSVNLTGLTPGTQYHYRVLSRDAAGNLATSADFTLATQAVTLTVDAGSNASAFLNQPAQLTGSFNYNGQNQVTFSWTQDSGPGTAVFTNPTSLSTQVSANTAGTYVLRLTATDGTLTSSDTVTFTVTDVDPTLAAHWKFDETSGTSASDSSGNNRTGTLTSGAAFTANGKVNGAVNLDGSNDYVNVAAFNITGQALTISAWVNPDTFIGTSRDNRIISKATGNSQNAHYWTLSTIAQGSETRLQFRLKAGGSTTTFTASTGNIPLNQWSHVVARYDGATVKLYLNGVEVGSAAKTGTLGTSSSAGINIGRNIGGYGEWDGRIDDTRVYARALSATEISQLAAVAPDTTAPIISGVNATGVSSTSATIVWNTDEAADSQVEYGTTIAYGTTTPLNPSLVASHSVPLSSLTPETTYHYRVISKDVVGNSTTSADFTFTTPATPPPSPVAHVQNATFTSETAASNIVRAFTNANTAGNTIVAAFSWGSSATPTCSDSQGNTYTVVTNQYDSQNSQALAICYATNIKAGANTVTVNLSSGAGWRRLIIHEYSGIAAVNPVDVFAQNLANGTTAANAITSGTATSTVNGALVFGAVMDDSGITSITPGTGFTQRNSVNNKDLATQDLIQPTAGSIASTQTFGAAHRYLAQMVIFKPAN